MTNHFLIKLLREEVKEAEQELQNLRISLRYKIGDVLLQALPISWRSFQVLPRLFKLYKNRASSSNTPVRNLSLSKQPPKSALISSNLALGVDFTDSSDFWSTSDAELMALRLYSDAPITSLVLRSLSVSVVRQLARIQQNGAKVIWWPDPAIEHPRDLEAYVVALADECRYGETE